MKKLILPFVALLIGMAACQKEDTNVLTLEVEHYNGDAKMHIDNQDFAVWDDGDTVWLNRNAKRVTVDNANHRATISPDGIYSYYYAGYPYDVATAYYQGVDCWAITLPEVQVYRENSQGEQIVAAQMAAYAADDNSTLCFRNLGSILAVEVQNNTDHNLSVHSIEVSTDNTDDVLWGLFIIDDLTTDGLTHYFGTCGNTVTLDCGDGVEVPAEGKVFYIALPVINEAHLTVKVDDGYGIYTLAQTNNTATFGRNTLHQVPFSASEDICEEYSLRPNKIKYTATSKLSGFEEEANVWGKTIVRHVYDETTQQGTITFNSDITSLPSYAFERRGVLLSIELPESVVTIGSRSFYGCPSLTSVSIPGVTRVDGGSFLFCYALTTLNLPSITSIGNGAFYCSGIQTITFGPYLSYLDVNVFKDCSSITDIYCKAIRPPHCEADSFYGMNCTPDLHVPHGSWFDYTNDDVWRLAFGNTWGSGSRIHEDCSTD